FFISMRPTTRSTLFPTRRSSDLTIRNAVEGTLVALDINPTIAASEFEIAFPPGARISDEKGRRETIVNEKGEPETVVKWASPPRSEEHTSELQSPYDLVCRLLLE